MPQDQPAAPKPLIQQRSTWMGLIICAISILAGILGRMDPLQAAAFAVAGLAVIFLRLSIADLQGMVQEAGNATKRWGFLLPLLGALALLPACASAPYPDLRPTLRDCDALLVKLRDDYGETAPPLVPKQRASRVRTIDEFRATIREALAKPAKPSAPKAGSDG